MGLDVFYSRKFADEYVNNNYKVIDYQTEPGDGYCYIYFSGNGIFDPDTQQEFYNTIVIADRYEWLRYRARIKVEREIFVRDINKCWYYRGINSQYDTIDKVRSLLQDLTNDYEGRIITVGSSAGGYAACLFGALLNAKRVFAFSPQFGIKVELKKLKERMNVCDNYKYVNIVSIISSSNVPIYYFYPCYVGWDIVQSQYIKSSPNIISFPIRSKLHGKAVYVNNMTKLLEANEFELDELRERFESKKTYPFILSCRIVGVPASIRGGVMNAVKPIYYKISDLRRSKAIVNDKNICRLL